MFVLLKPTSYLDSHLISTDRLITGEESLTDNGKHSKSKIWCSRRLWSVARISKLSFVNNDMNGGPTSSAGPVSSRHWRHHPGVDIQCELPGIWDLRI